MAENNEYEVIGISELDAVQYMNCRNNENVYEKPDIYHSGDIELSNYSTLTSADTKDTDEGNEY